MTEISYYEVPHSYSTFGEEKFLTRVILNSNLIPIKGSLIGFDDMTNSYRVVDVSYWYSYPEDRLNEDDAICSVYILVFNENNIKGDN